MKFKEKQSSIEWYEKRHQEDCIAINQLQTALDVLIDRYSQLRKQVGL